MVLYKNDDLSNVANNDMMSTTRYNRKKVLNWKGINLIK